MTCRLEQLGGGLLHPSRDLVDVPRDSQLHLVPEPPPASLSEPLLNAPEAARLLAVRTSWVYDAVRDGRLPCVRIGRHIRFLRSDLERWVREQAAPPRRH